jgi:hypothetical protein
MVWCHWLLVVDAPQCAEDAMSEHQLTLLQRATRYSALSHGDVRYEVT